MLQAASQNLLGLSVLAAALLISSLKPQRKALVFIVALAFVTSIYSVNLEEFFTEKLNVLKVVVAIFGLEVLSALLKKGRFFELSSRKILRKIGSPTTIFIVLNILTALLSALLSNTLVLSYMMLTAASLTACIPEFDPVELMISLVISSNLGSMATLIGDVSNVIVSVNAGIGFLDFMTVAAPISIISTLTSLSILLLRLVRRGRPSCVLEVRMEPDSREEHDRSYLIFGLFSMTLMLTLLPLSRRLGTDESLALGVTAIFLLFLGGERISKVFMDVDWASIVYLGSLLLVTEIISHFGGFKILLEWVSGMDTRLNVYLASIGLSTLIDDAEAVAILYPTLRELNASRGTWWALIIGTTIGSALTPWGSIANLIALRTIRERYNIRISPAKFLYITTLAVSPVIPLAYGILSILGGE